MKQMFQPKRIESFVWQANMLRIGGGFKAHILFRRFLQEANHAWNSEALYDSIWRTVYGLRSSICNPCALSTQAFTSLPLSFLRLFGLVLYWIKSKVAATPRAKARVWSEQRYEFGKEVGPFSWISTSLTSLGIFLLFSKCSRQLESNAAYSCAGRFAETPHSS